MKSIIKKTTAGILAVVMCAAIAVTGVTAASAVGATQDQVAVGRTDNFSKAALADGVWQASASSGDSEYIILDSAHQSIVRISPETCTGVPCSYTFIEAIGMYKLTVGAPGNEEQWRVIENNDTVAVLRNENGEYRTLNFIMEGNLENFSLYSCRELCEMARAYYEATGGDTEGVSYIARLIPECPGCANIWVYVAGAHGCTLETYTVSTLTGIGTDRLGNSVDLSVYA